jgi:3-oxoacyl-[acyl-carrier-protein] synthase II
MGRASVVITGMGVWCAIGRDLAEFRQSLYIGRDGASLVPAARFSTESAAYRTRKAATLIDGPVEPLARSDATVLADVAIRVAEEALQDGGLPVGSFEPQEMGLVLGTTVGGSYAFIRFVRGKLGLPGGDRRAILGPCTAGSMTGTVAKYFKIQGPVSTVSTACAAGANSLGRAFDLIRRGNVRFALAGGVDLFSELTFSGFNALQALGRNGCRPFDETRDGLMLGDAGAILLLETRESANTRGARIYAEFAGYATANEAYHATGPDPEGTGAITVMHGALAQAGIPLRAVEYINAHGTGTKANDDMELKAIRTLFGDHTPNVYVSSTKSMIGHTLGAAGSVEAIATTIGMYHHFMPPSINLSTPMTGSEDIKFVIGTALNKDFSVALSNSFGFGGNVASIVIKKNDIVSGR